MYFLKLTFFSSSGIIGIFFSQFGVAFAVYSYIVKTTVTKHLNMLYIQVLPFILITNDTANFISCSL